MSSCLILTYSLTVCISVQVLDKDQKCKNVQAILLTVVMFQEQSFWD